MNYNMNKISVKDTKIYKKKFKRISETIVLMTPCTKDKFGDSLGVYYGENNSTPIVATRYDRKSFKRNDLLNDMFYATFGNSAKVVITPSSRYYVAPYYNAGTLADLLNESVIFSEEEISPFILQIAERLAKLHEIRGVYHGELTPDHIIINKNEDGTITYNICGFGHFMQKPKEYYMNKERKFYIDKRILEDPNKRYDGACDIWSLSILMYKMVTGNFPEDNYDPECPQSPYERLEPTNDISVSFFLERLMGLCHYAIPEARIEAKIIKYQAFFIPIRTDISNYVNDKELGSGSFGTVHLTYLKNKPSQLYATKQSFPVKKSETIQRILVTEELTILLIMRNSPYTINVVDWFIYDNDIYFVLDYFNGGDLMKYMKLCDANLKKEENDVNCGWKRTDLHMLEDVMIILFNLAHSLYDMHEKGLIHRDVKPDNMLISIDEKTKRLSTAKLSDFGTSRRMLGEQASTRIGTSEYMAPELLTGEYTYKADEIGRAHV